MDKILIVDCTTNDFTLVSKVEEGVPMSEIVAFGRQTGFLNEELAKFIGLPTRTFIRRASREGCLLTTVESERAVRLMRLFCRARQVLGSNEEARCWLGRRLRVLGMRTPLDFANTEPGAREAEAVLGRFEGGGVS